MLVQQYAAFKMTIPFDNSSTPSGLFVKVWRPTGVYTSGGAVDPVSIPDQQIALLQFDVTATDTTDLGDVVFVVSDGTINYGYKSVQVVPWNPADVDGLGLTRLDATISSRGTANAGDNMGLTPLALADVAAAVDLVGQLVETGVSVGDVLKVMAAMAAGEVVPFSGGAAFYNWAGTKERIHMPIGSGGARGPATLDLS